MNIQKIALTVLMAFAFYACSDDVANIASGDPDTANLAGDNAVLASEKDQTPKSPSDSTDAIEPTVYRNIKVVTASYPLISLYELDSVSFDATSLLYETQLSTISDEENIDSLSLKSPYVLIEASHEGVLDNSLGNEYKSIRSRSIVDVRQSTQMVANVKTHLESFRLVHLMKSGMDFAAAKDQAGREVLRAFGFYEDPSHADDIENVRNQDYKNYLWFIRDFISERISVDTAVARIARCGSLDCDSETERESLVHSASLMFKEFNHYATDSVAIQKKDGDNYFNNKASRSMSYLFDFLALMSGLEHCTSANDGIVHEIPNENIVLSCRNAKWNAAYKSMEWTSGTMVDSRDGKTYKTVTYNIKDKPVTWMAQNLAYRDSTMDAPCDDCELYYFGDAMNLDTTLFMSVNACMDAEFADCPNCVWRDTVQIRKDCQNHPFNRLDESKFKVYVDSIKSASGFYQGICPDGWHLSERSEWESLLDYLKEFYLPEGEDEWPGQRDNWVMPFLFETAVGNPSGFGLREDLSKLSNAVVHKYFVVYDKYGPEVHVNYGDVDLYGFTGRYVWESPAIDFVRCVKN